MSKKDSYIFFDKDTAFEGEVDTDHLVLEGMISGEIRASKEVTLKKGSIVQGEIATKKYNVEEGSIHQGMLSMDQPVQRVNGNGREAGRENPSEGPASEEITISVSAENGDGKDRSEATDEKSPIERLW